LGIASGQRAKNAPRNDNLCLDSYGVLLCSQFASKILSALLFVVSLGSNLTFHQFQFLLVVFLAIGTSHQVILNRGLQGILVCSCDRFICQVLHEMKALIAVQRFWLVSVFEGD
jgi:hypothetical protein